MPDRLTTAAPVRRSVVLGLALLVAVIAAVSLPDARTAEAGNGSRAEQLRFMWAMAGQESGRDYFARNTASGAFGKYQIMPFNWSNWAADYVGDRRADQTPYNQEKVAYGKLRDLYGWLGSWKRVAYWWLTGKSDPNEKRWSSYASRYVKNIMRERKRAPAGWPMPARTSSKSTRGDWRRAGSDMRLRKVPGGAAWPARGKLRDGQVLKVRSAKGTRSGIRWVRVVTADGRLGWLKQLDTVPARKPAQARRWNDVKDSGEPPARDDRWMVRPRPR